jgi:uncharacterized membrane protein
MTTILGTVLLILAIALLVIGVLAWRRKLPGNPVIGIRVAEVRKSQEIWEAAHQVAGPLWLVGGAALVFGGLVAFRAEGWMWLLPVLAVIVALAAVGAGANIGARRAAAIDVAQKYEEEHAPAPAAPAPKVDMDALRRAADAADDKNLGDGK